jgi:hypothetical protein
MACVSLPLIGRQFSKVLLNPSGVPKKQARKMKRIVLIASLVPVQFKTSSKCRVVSGKWIGLFTGQTFTDPSELDIDHVVPLKEAHESGAWQWDAEKRRRFANYLGDANHLIAVHRSAPGCRWLKISSGCDAEPMRLPFFRRFHCRFDHNTG